MITAKLSKEKLEKRLKKIIRAIKRPEAFYKTWAHSVVRLARRNALAKSKGGNFWLSIADQTKITSVSRRGAVIECLHFAGMHKHTGGIIRAKHAGALTIPIAPEAKGRRASEFLTEGRTLFVPKGKSVLGYSEDGVFKALYVLRKSVTQKAEPWWPSEEEAGEIGIREARWWIRKQIRK